MSNSDTMSKHFTSEMFRYLYILISIPLCFCYDFIETQQQFTNPKDNSEIQNVKHAKRKVVQFDVASFLRNTATEKLHDYEPYAFVNKEDNGHTQSDYYYDHPNENIKKSIENINYFNTNTDFDSDESKDEDRFQPNPQIDGEIAKNEDGLVSENKAKNTESELLLDGDFVNPENKCAFKNMKVPFFSHKSTTTKQKRKLICFHCSKRYAKDTLPDTNPKITQLKHHLMKNYGNLCPKCIRKLLKHKKVPEKTKTIHNSREFYQNLAKNAKNKIPQKCHQTTRLKRDDTEEEKRQLKELEEVERKVDNVEVTTPKFHIVPYTPRIDGKA